MHWACSGGRYEVADFLVGQLKVPVNMQDDVRSYWELNFIRLLSAYVVQCFQKFIGLSGNLKVTSMVSNEMKIIQRLDG